MAKIMLIDGNSIGFANHQANNLTYDGQPVQAIFGFIKTLKRLKEMFRDYDLIVLWDGISWRYNFYSEYKANRKDPKIERMKAEYKKQQPAIKRSIELLGINQITAKNLEADDLGAILSKKYSDLGNEVLLVTGDKDWIQLINNKVTWFDPIRDRQCNLSNLEDFTGCKNIKQFVDLKCLTGDTSDNVKGVGGIGENRAKAFLQQYDNVEKFIGTNFSDQEVDGWNKYLRDFYKNTNSGIDKYYSNYKLMALNLDNIPKPESIDIVAGKQNFDDFIDFCAEYGFASIRIEINAFINLFGKKNNE